MDMGGRRVRCRKYPWGTVEGINSLLIHQLIHASTTLFSVENLEHNDFAALREMLIRTHMMDLVDVTKSVHYENFRCRQLMSVSDMDTVDMARDPFTQMEEEKVKHAQKLKKQESDMETVFQVKLKEKMGKLKETEAEVIIKAQEISDPFQ